MPAVLILAAGKGTRLGDLGRQRAKVLVPIGDRPLLDLHLAHLAAQGVRRVVINAHHLSEQIGEHVRSYRGPLEVSVLVEPTLLGTAGAAVNARELLGTGRFVVLYGDVLIFEPLAPMLEAHASSRAIATICVYACDQTQSKGVVDVDEDDRVLRFSEKDPARTGPGLVNAGLYVIEPPLLAGVRPRTFADFGHDVFPGALRAGQHIQAHRISRPVLDIGTPRDLARAAQGDAVRSRDA